MINKPITNGIITRLLTLLQKFNITILYRPGKQNTVVDFLSRIQNDNNDVHVEDNFPDEYIFIVYIKSPCFPDIYNYLAIGNLSSYLSPGEKINLIQISASYSWINEELYITELNLIIRRRVREDEV